MSAAQGESLTDCLKDKDYRELLEIAEKGLPKTETPQHVAVVGAGIAGLTTAKILEDAGHKVTIVEASGRVGGRVETLRNEEEGWYMELGAMRIPSFHQILQTFASKFGVSLNAFVEADINTYYLVNGLRFKTYAVDSDPDILNYTLNREERGKSADDLLDMALSKINVEVQKFGCEAMFKKYDSYSVKEFLVKEANLSQGAIRMIGDILNENSLFYTALTEMLYDQADISDENRYFSFDLACDTYCEVTGGTDTLVKGFLKNLSATILLKSRVKRISQSDSGVTVSFQGPDQSPLTDLTADVVVVTATARATLLVDFLPPLSLLKMEALRSVHYDSSTKVILVFKERFWEKEGIRGGKSITDRPSRFIYYPSPGHSDPDKPGGPLLASYTWSDDSLLFLGMSDEDLKEVVLKDLSLIHGEHIRPLCTGVVVKKWSLDPYSMGAFALFTPYQKLDYADELFRSEGRVHFAGEHVAFPRAWIETSMKAAIRVAKRINASPSDNIKRDEL
ncbi:L-amino-acid oxidase-like [Aplochiton taeniatus]